MDGPTGIPQLISGYFDRRADERALGSALATMNSQPPDASPLEGFTKGVMQNPRLLQMQGFGTLANLLEHAEKQREQQKSQNATAKAVKQIFKNNPQLQGLAGLSAEDVDGLGTTEALKTFEAAVTGHALKKAAQDMEHQRAMDEQSRMAEAASRMAVQRFGEGPRALAQLAQPSENGLSLRDLAPNLAAPASMNERLMHASRTPGLDLKGLQALGNFGRDVQALEETTAPQFSFDANRDVVPVPQVPGLYFGRNSKGGGQFIETAARKAEIASGVADARQGAKPRAAADAEPIRSKDGKLYYDEATGSWKPVRISDMEMFMKNMREDKTVPDAAKETLWQSIKKYLPASDEPAGTNAPAKSAVTTAEKVIVIKDGQRYRLPKSQLKDAEAQGYKLAE